jgi:hypothetical protein
MTGVEAVSNGVRRFPPDEERVGDARDNGRAGHGMFVGITVTRML